MDAEPKGEVLARLFFPLDMGKVGELLMAFGKVFPGCKVRKGSTSLELEIYLPEEVD